MVVQCRPEGIFGDSIWRGQEIFHQHKSIPLILVKVIAVLKRLGGLQLFFAPTSLKSLLLMPV